MSPIRRDPAALEQANYDLIVIGGGIYGAMLSLEAGFRGLRSLLLEKDDFGGATSYNSLRIIHGGFRYLQTLDLKRFYESVGERKWFLKTFPDLVKPLPCLIPLYGQGAKRPSILTGALGLNDLLSVRRNSGVSKDCQLPRGKMVDIATVRSHFPNVDTAGLKGGALWFDASMSDSQRVLMNVLRWAATLGGTALNYVKAEEVLSQQNKVIGVRGRDTIADKSYEYKAPIVINACGPQAGELAQSTDLFRPSLAWNLLFDRPALSRFALAIAPKQLNAQTYFLHPWKNRLLAGTIHSPWNQSIDTHPKPSEQQIETFINNLNKAIPNLDLQRSEVVRILAGILPVKQTGSVQLCSKETIINSETEGFYSIAGVKFTTSRLVAHRTLKRIFPDRERQETKQPKPSLAGQYDYDWKPSEGEDWLLPLKKIVADEAVLHLDDLLFRRTSLADNPKRGIACSQPIVKMMAEILDWKKQRCDEELRRLRQTVQLSKQSL